MFLLYHEQFLGTRLKAAYYYRPLVVLIPLTVAAVVVALGVVVFCD